MDSAPVTLSERFRNLGAAASITDADVLPET